MMISCKARHVDLHQVAKEIIEYWIRSLKESSWWATPVAWWENRLWIVGRMYDEAQAKREIARDMKVIGIECDTPWDVHLVFLNVVALTAKDYPSDPINEVFNCFENTGEWTYADASAYYKEWTDKYYPPILCWDGMIRQGMIPGASFK